MSKKKEEKKEEKVDNLLKELCGDDAKLYDFLNNAMLTDPLTGVSKKDLDILTEEAEKSGNFRDAVDKAIFEAAQNPGEKERYIKVIQNLASKTIHATEQEKEKAEKKGLIDRAASLGSRIENHKFMSERAEDIINAASIYYNEKLEELGEKVKRESRERETESEEQRIGELERAQRETRKKERRKMGRKEKREAKKKDKREELEAKERKKERGRETEKEEQRIVELERAGLETRKKERREN